MATKKSEQVEPVGRADPEVKEKKESTRYTLEELAGNAKLFGVRRECVEAALRQALKAEVTLAEAGKIIKEFMNKEVR